MTRSNKNKFPHKPPSKHPTTNSTNQLRTITQSLMSDERQKMISRSKRSAKYHGINLKHGTPNPGTGDCAIQSVLQNINDRRTFKEKFPLSTNYYRRMWATDMANRTVDTDWNIYSRDEWLRGWQDMMIPGTYERGIYGDLMLPGIACGVRKILLIFNTNPETPHDPIYVVDPMQFNIQPDSEMPIILAYNMSHYESMHPCSEADVRGTAELVREYLGTRYRFNKNDFPFLLGLEEEASPNKIPKLIESYPREKKCREEKTTPILFMERKNNDLKEDTKIDLEEIDQFLDKVKTREEKEHTPAPQNELVGSKGTGSKLNKENKKGLNFPNETISDSHRNSDFTMANLCYKLKNKSLEYVITEVAAKFKCPICEELVKNINLHFNKNLECENKIDRLHFQTEFAEFTKQKKKEQARLRQQNSRARKINESEESRLALLEKNRLDNKNLRARKINESEESRLAMLEKNRQDKKNLRARKTNESEESHLAILKKNRQDKKNLRAMHMNESEKSRLAILEKIRQQTEKSRNVKKDAVDQVTRRKNFSKAVIFGPIFICSCCARMLFENGVTKITSKFKEAVNIKNPSFNSSCIVGDSRKNHF